MRKKVNNLPQLLLPWYEKERRDLPWRKDKEPYHVWLSEIMLQQTRVEAVKGYYERFLAALPTVEALAEAPADLCRKLWEGLGYYSRVKNLQKAAKQIKEEHGGVFPQNYGEVRALAGIGDYTAGAICSICFSLPTPAVDGNVLRVFARLRADDRPVQDAKVKKELTELLREIYPREAPGTFTQALMELGATVCVPNGEPTCAVCPVRELCKAYRQGRQGDFPVRLEKKPRRVEEKTVFILTCGERVAVEKRGEQGLLAGLWQYPNVPGHLNIEQALQQAEAWGLKPDAPQKIVERKHLFTHIEWRLRAVYIICKTEHPRFTWATKEELESTYALPTAFRMLGE